MNANIEAILFDMGGTLRYTTRRTPAEQAQLYEQMMALIGARQPVEDFSSMLGERAHAYKQWAGKTHVELKESDLWTRWMLPDYPPESIAPAAVQLNQLFREAQGRRIPFPETPEVVTELFRRGYRLGLVSNTTSSVEVPAMLRELRLSGLFETVILSAVAGVRKPSPGLLLEAAARMGVATQKCAYIGDRVDRDLAAAREAGFAAAVIIDQAQPECIAVENTGLTPDAVIDNLRDLLALFPARPAPRPEIVYDAALSTMYAIDNFPNLADFFEFARRAGFTRVELNHKVTSAMLEGIDLSRCPIGSVHEPCPADISETELKRRGWLISAVDEASRIEGVNSIKRSIDLARQAGAKVVVIHAGEVVPDTQKLERKLRAMVASRDTGTSQYRTIQAQMIALRAEAARASFAALKQSILDLLAYADGTGICLGLENRYHFLEMPSPDELEILLGLAGPERIGFVYDIGHAFTLEYLGFYPARAWLERFAGRTVLTHLHDLVDTTDHYAPGLGTADFRMAGERLGEGVFRTCEIQTFNLPEQVKAGLQYLAEQGCINTL